MGSPAPPRTAEHPFLDKEAGKIRGLFDRIAPRYDLLNHLFSFQLDRRWRRLAISALAPLPGARILDACTGTGDLALALARHSGGSVPVVGCDFSVPMLQRARRKDTRRQVGLAAGDTLQLPFPSARFDGAMVAFGIRNVQDLDAGLRELARVLRPGARLVVLEFTPVANPLLRPLLAAYTHGLMPLLGNLIARSRERAYSYLQQSIDRWPDAVSFARRLQDAGFEHVRHQVLFPGNVALHQGERRACPPLP